MKHAAHVLVACLAVVVLSAGQAQGAIWDYTRAYDSVLDIPYGGGVGGTYLNMTVALQNVTVINEGACAFYQVTPSASPASQTGIILFHFTFVDPVDEGHLRANFALWRWGYGYGAGTLYGSKNNSTWLTLMPTQGPPPMGTAIYPVYNADLPAELLGGQDLWFKAVIDNTNTTGSGDQAWRNTGQFLRSSRNDGVMDFQLDANFVPEPATLTLLALGGLGVLLRRRRK